MYLLLVDLNCKALKVSKGSTLGAGRQLLRPRGGGPLVRNLGSFEGLGDVLGGSRNTNLDLKVGQREVAEVGSLARNTS